MTITGNLLRCGPIVPEFIMRMTGVKPGAKTLYAVLVRSCGLKDHCWPSQAYLSACIGQCVRSVQNYLRELVEVGLIEIKPGRYGNIYTLRPHPAVVAELERRAASQANRTASPASAPACANPSGRCAKIAPGINSKERQEDTPLSPLAGADAAFADIWRIWPVQEARKTALRTWRRLWRSSILPGLDALVGSIKHQLAHNPRWKRGFVPHLATWLRGRRWEDQLSAQLQDPASAEVKEQKAIVRQGERKPSAQELPAHVRSSLTSVLAFWPSAQLSEAEQSRLQGLWSYLYHHKRLPDFDEIRSAAIGSTANFLRWLHEYAFTRPRNAC